MNPDDAAYCQTCGALMRVQTQSQALQGASASFQSSTKLFAETVPGNHQHILSDITLTDAAGAQLLTAKKPSMMHEHFDILDANGEKRGEVNRKMHLAHQGFEVIDLYGSLLGTVNLGAHQRYSPPNGWLEDQAGNKVAKFAFESSILNFALVKNDGTKVFEARIGGGSGVFGTLQSIGKKRFEIDLYDQNFSELLLIGAMAALDSAG